MNQLGNSRALAMQRFLTLEKRLIKNKKLYDEYKMVMDEYEQMGLTQEIQEDNEGPNYYLPHHAVVKQSSVTTRLRIVFDAGMKTDTGLALNDTQYSGPVIQQDLFSIILRFRKYEYVMTADISKMYRMIFA